MTTLTTHIEIPSLGPGEIEVEVDYTYAPTTRELLVGFPVAVIGTERLPCWHLMTPLDRQLIEEQCVTDYRERMEAAVVSNREFRDVE